MASRSLDDLHPAMKQRAIAHINACKAEGIELLVTCTYRSPQEQDQLYAKGRTAPGPRVTNARAGQSAHNFHLAYDIVPLIGGKPLWDTSQPDHWHIWSRVGELGKAQGLEWGGDWKSIKDYPHFQYLGGHPLTYFAGGGNI